MEETRSRCPNPKLWCWERTAAWTQRPSFKQLSPVMKIHSNRLIDYLVTLLPRWVWCVHTCAHTCTRACTHTHTCTCTATCGYICRKDEAVPPESLCSGLNTISQQAGQCTLIFPMPRLLSLVWDVCWPRRSRCCRQMAGESPGNWRVIRGLLLQCRQNLQAQLASLHLPPFPKARPGLKVLLHWKGRKWNWDGQPESWHTWHLPPINWLKSVQFSSASQTHLVKCGSVHC